MGRPKALTHLDAEGAARMVDVGAKETTEREAVAEAFVRLSRATCAQITAGAVPKGDVLAVARIAGIQAAKRTPELIPLCHTVRLTSCEVSLTVRRDSVRVEARVRASDRTGVEMEALTAASVAALTLYDMVKSLERGAVIERVALLEKRGGAGGPWRRPR